MISIPRFMAMVGLVAEESLSRLQPLVASDGSKVYHTFEDVDLYTWQQAWGDTSCGFGGGAGQTITGAYTIVVESQLTQECLVWHAGRLAYSVKRPSDEFRHDMARRHMDGGRGCPKKYLRPEADGEHV